MEFMHIQERTAALVQLGDYLRVPSAALQAAMEKAFYFNAWFTLENQEIAIQAIANQFLAQQVLTEWIDRYSIPGSTTPKTIGLVMAGNLPLVGFHDFLCVFVAGHRAQIKLSDKDAYLLPHLLEKLVEINPKAAGYFEYVERLAGFDAVVATGSNNSARYFETYFNKYPHIIRKNRNGVAVLNGQEDKEALIALGRDIFQYFGLGCRNVSKIYVPEGYDLDYLLEVLHEEYKEVILTAKYKHNYDYNFALYLINREPFKMNGCLLLTENEGIPSRIAGLNYAYYQEVQQVEAELRAHQEEIQCIVATPDTLGLSTLPFGTSQSPGLYDYPDGVDTLRFLLDLL